MDKHEYKICSEEIKTLIGRKRYTEAMEIADTVDWRKVKSVNMLCMVSDLYKINRKYEESRDILLLAYEQYPGGRRIVYSLCELSIKLDDVVHAVEYYKEFVQIAPRDNGRYILQYKLYEAQEVTLEERIAVLEELKSREYREKWAYELAYLYHRIGLGTKCVEECDELILWFGEGKYVLKAMELKLLHAPLSAEQKKKYKKIKGVAAPEMAPPEKIDEDLDIEVPPVNVGKYATINLQKELAESMKEVLQEDGPFESGPPTIEYEAVGAGSQTEEDFGPNTEELEAFAEEEEFFAEENFAGEQEYYAAEKTYGAGNENVPAEEAYAAGYESVPVEEAYAAGYESVPAEEIYAAGYESVPAEEAYAAGYESVPAEEAYAAGYESVPAKEMYAAGYENVPAKEMYAAGYESVPAEETYPRQRKSAENESVSEVRKVSVREREQARDLQLGGAGDFTQEILTNLFRSSEEEEEVSDTEEVFFEDADTAEMPAFSVENEKRAEHSAFDNLLSQEYDGQISLAVPEADAVEKQITGQISLEDVLLEWERVKKENEEKRAEAVRQRVKEQTGEIFSQFDASTKQGILAELDALAENLEEKEKQGLTGEEEKSQEKAVDMEEDLPEVEELVEIEEKTATESFSDEVIDAANRAIVEEEHPADGENRVESAAGEETLDKEAADKGAAQRDDAGRKEETPERKEEAEKRIEDRQERPQRPMTTEEKKLFGSFIQTKSTRDQILDTLDNISLASYTGNVILTGEPGMGSIKLAKNMIKEIQMTDNNFSGKMAKITGQALNHKDMEKTFERLSNGALIVEGAGHLKENTVKSMTKLLEQEKQGIIVILEDTKINMNKLLDHHSVLRRNFNLRIDVEALDNDSLVLFGKKYALEREYAIDELGVLALYTRISEMQTSEHSVTTREVKEIVDEAIDHAGKKNMGHFMDILFGKRYDDEDMIILREKDFV